jgi:hypothetical protein
MGSVRWNKECQRPPLHEWALMLLGIKLRYAWRCLTTWPKLAALELGIVSEVKIRGLRILPSHKKTTKPSNRL